MVLNGVPNAYDEYYWGKSFRWFSLVVWAVYYFVVLRFTNTTVTIISFEYETEFRPGRNEDDNDIDKDWWLMSTGGKKNGKTKITCPPQRVLIRFSSSFACALYPFTYKRPFLFLLDRFWATINIVLRFACHKCLDFCVILIFMVDMWFDRTWDEHKNMFNSVKNR